MSRNNGIPEGVPTASIEIAGEEYPLVYTLGTALRLRRQLRKRGIDVDDPAAVAGADQSEVLFLTLWAMAAHGEHKGLEPDEFADRIPMSEFDSILERVETIRDESEPDLPDEDDAEGEPEARRTEKEPAGT